MIPEEIKKNIIVKYERLCKKLKVNNWQKQIFFENATVILEDVEKRLEIAEKKLDKLDKNVGSN